MGGLNAKVGHEQNSEIVNKYRLGSCNKCGEKWVQECTANDQQLVYTTNSLLAQN